jgi:predicted RNase H-like nuclease (RuvC/YqgF family)
MADTSELVSGIEHKIYRLIGKHRQTLAENERFCEEIGELKKKLEEHRIKIEEFENKLNILKTTGTLENREGSVAAKARISDLLREIDKCIGLLNV